MNYTNFIVQRNRTEVEDRVPQAAYSDRWLWWDDYRMGLGEDGSPERGLGAVHWTRTFNFSTDRAGFEGFLDGSRAEFGLATIGAALPTARESGNYASGAVVALATASASRDGQELNDDKVQNDSRVIAAAFVATGFPDGVVGTPQAAYSDPLLGSYWHLKGTSSVAGGANVVKVWDDFRGSGVLVGVIDDGIEYTHTELAGNYDFALDYDSRDLDFDAFPADSTDKHGTTVAGVIAAALDNAAGGAGVAPEATVTGYRIGFGDNGTYDQLIGAFEWISTVDVANNSWGFDGFLGDSFLNSGFAPIGDALQAALVSGRGGLGTVIVFAAGNGRAGGQDVNYHNLQNDRGTIAVAATDSGGKVTSYSNPGAALLIAAPGHGIPTTDRVGALGYSSGDYVTLNGTSFAAPLISGVVALMLDANAGLGWRDVQEILASTAVRTGGATGWSFNDADNWNGGAMHVSHDYGFGLVDAYAAVRVAESWRGVSTSANERVFGSDLVTLDSVIPDLGSVSDGVVLPDGMRIDHLEIDVVLQHANIGQLEITLTAPDGTQSILFDTPPTSGNMIYFTFSTTRDWGELSGGLWTLTVADTQAGATGTLTAWALRAYGDLAGDDTYVYTDEFSALALADPTRLELSDTGGVDTINTTAIASETLLDLRPGYTMQIGGQNVTISAGTLIENADTGDGNDVLTGNDAENTLNGWRGNDTLNGGLGADTLIGGEGDDRYYVGTGDLVVELANEGSDIVYSSVSWTLGANLERIFLAGSAPVNATGNDLGNILYGNGNSAVNVLTGGLGDDVYYVGAGDLVVEGASAGKDIVYSSISWTLDANLERLYLEGSSAVSATGNGLDNVLYGHGNSAANVLSGGEGDDNYYVGTNDTVAEGVEQGKDSVYSYGTYTLAPNVENLYLNDSSAATLTGNNSANSLQGNSGNDTLRGLLGNDTLDGGLGADTLIGGEGDDRYYVGTGDLVVELANEGSDMVYSSVSWTLGANLERIFLAGSAPVNATGNDLANILYGNGNSAVNVLTGGLGDDVYYVGAGDLVVEGASAGKDIVYSSISWVLDANLERLYLEGSSAVSATGNGLANVLYGHGNSAANVLSGGEGDDNYYVGTNDTVAEGVEQGKDSVYSYGTYTLAPNVENLYLNDSSAATLTGNNSANSLQGNSGNDTLRGLLGNDTLDGGLGADTLIGGEGDDRYYVGTGDLVVELANEGSDMVYSSVSWTLGANLERIFLAGSAPVNATGNDLGNILYGNGNSAVNVLTGGLGDDVYYVGAGDLVVEGASAGKDIVYSSISWVLDANLERLYLEGSSAVSATGNGLANVLYGHGNSAANVLSARPWRRHLPMSGLATRLSKWRGKVTIASTAMATTPLAANVENLYLNVSAAATLKRKPTRQHLGWQQRQRHAQWRPG
jgi:subtilisin family serine protease/Ca2+-binding RTX toxin-like protein